LQRLGWTASRRAWGHAALWLPLAAVLAGGRLDALSLMQEWAQRQDVWAAACWRHLQIVVTALLPALLLGVPLGVLVARRPRPGQRLLALLGQVQTMPSIALFGLLIAPLAALGTLWPGSGIQGVGLWPAALALVAYALLPIVAGVAAGLQQVEPAVVEAARGMGLTRGQRLRQVELPLALPALWSALRLAAVQGVGLAVVAALIGAGGLGTLVFQGLAAGALDLVLLGVLPVVVMAVVLDALLGTWAASSRIGRVAPLPPSGLPA
ncbi:MAG: ABC transporter permease, partial [Aquabacterium sp.]